MTLSPEEIEYIDCMYEESMEAHWEYLDRERAAEEYRKWLDYQKDRQKQEEEYDTQ